MIKMRFFNNHIKLDIECILLALIICVNCVRYMMGITESNLVIYGLYLCFIGCFLITNYKYISKTVPRDLGIIIILSMIWTIYAVITGLMGNADTLLQAIKLLIMLTIAILIIWMPIEKILETMQWSLLVCTVYVVYILTNSDYINTYLSRGSNYLILSLPIGLILTVMMARIVCIFFFEFSLKKMWIYILLCVLYFMALIKFSGRGSIIFPFIVVIILVMMLSKKNWGKFFLGIVILVLVVYVAFQAFLENADPYTVDRMLRLFNQNQRGEEDRWFIWNQYIEYVIHNGWYIFGGGTGASVEQLGFYPHNFYLQMIGEFGILGILISVYITIFIVKRELNTCKLIIKMKHLSDKYLMLHFEIIAGLLYLFLSYMKSFTIYDAGSFFIFIAFTIKICSYFCKIEKN